MESNANYTIVGAFVVVLTAAIVLAIIWLSSGFSIVQYTTYEVEMQESVSGLTLDSAVEYNGVIVGSVKSIKINRKNPHIVDLLLSVKAEVPVTQGTVATLAIKGITGVAFVALKDDGKNPRPIKIRPNRYYPIIPTSPSFFVRLDTALTQLNASFLTISKGIEALLDKENLQSIKTTLISLRKVSESLASHSKDFNSIILNTKKATQQLTPVIQSSDIAVKSIENQTLPVFNQLLKNLNDVARTLSEVSNELKQNPSILIRGKAPAAPGPGE